MNTSRLGIIVATLVLLLAACSPGDPTGGTGDGGAEPDDQTPTGEWVLVEGTVEGTDLLPPPTHRITLNVADDGTVNGTAACNGYGGTIAVGGDTLSITELGSTEMACSPEAVMESEKLYLSALAAVDRFSADATGLVLTGGDAIEMRFEPVAVIEDAALFDTTWVLDTLIEGDAASSVSGDPAFLVLTSDGRIQGTTGCREIVGTYTVSGDEILANDLGALGSCNSRLVPQDGLVLEVLGDGFTTLIEGDHLTLSSAGGVGLRYTEGGAFSH